MKAAVLSGIHQVGLKDVPKPELVNDTDVIIKVTATMICTSEVHYAEGYLPPCPPFVIGHEFVGVIEEVGAAVTTLAVGDRVLAPPYPFCNNCDMCRNGITGLCPSGALFGSGEGWGEMSGGLAEYVRAPLADSALLKVPDDVSDERAVFVADMLATGYFGVLNADLKPQQTVAVIGAGPVGLCALQLTKLYSPAQIILVGRRSNRLDLGTKMGATSVIDTALVEDTAAEVMRLTGGVGVDAVIDSVGTPESLETSAQLLRIGGALSIVGFPAPGEFNFPMQTLLMKNVTVKMGLTDQSNMPFLMDLLQSGKVDVDPLITHVMPFDEFGDAFTMFAEKHDNCMKVVLKP